MMKTKKRILSALLAAALVVGLAACGQGGGSSSGASTDGSASGEPGAAAPEGRTTEISVTLASAPETIDPAMNSSVDGFSYLIHLSEGLMKYKWDGTGIDYGLAESYEVSEDGLVWTFKLRDGILWSDGSPITAADFEYSWKRLVDPAQAAPYAQDMGGYIKNGAKIFNSEDGLVPEDLGVKAVDDQTLEVTLEGPCAYFNEIAAFPAFMPVPRASIESAGDKWTRDNTTYLTSGPFKMEEFNMDANLIVVPNENYYDRDKLVATKITFQFLADEVARLNALQSGEVMYTKDYPLEEKKSLEEKGLNGMNAQLGTYYITFNTKQAPFDDINVRKAMSLALDREYLANTVQQGDMMPAYSYVGPGFNDVDGKSFSDVGGGYVNKDYEAAKAEAKQALADAGYPDGAGFPKVEYLYNDATIHQNIGEAMQNMWLEVLGINVEMNKQEWNVFQDTRRKGNYQIARDGWIADFNDPMAMLTIFITGGGNNNGQYSNPDFDALLVTATTSTDRAERMTAMHSAEELLLAKEWVCAPVLYYAELYAVEPGLKDWYSLPLGAQFFHTAYYEK